MILNNHPTSSQDTLVRRDLFRLKIIHRSAGQCKVSSPESTEPRILRAKRKSVTVVFEVINYEIPIVTEKGRRP